MKTTNFKSYPIFKKRDGQQWVKVNEIFANGFIEAKKKFAQMMVNDNHNKSNDIVWLDKSEGVKETGFYDLNASELFEYKLGVVDFSKSKMDLFCSEKSINRGFAYWNEDVYSYELRNIKL